MARSSSQPAEKPRWPKTPPPLTEEQLALRDRFARLRLESKNTGWRRFLEKFNQGYALGTFYPGCRTLEIGAGLGAHLPFERLGDQRYHAVELKPELCEALREKYPQVDVIAGDCQKRLPFEDGYFDRILAIHILEHLPDLPACLRELWRLLRDEGRLAVVIPTEGGLATRLARNLSGRKEYERNFPGGYDWLIKSEHINMPDEIVEELERLFRVTHRRYYPLFVPSLNLNIFIGLTLTKKKAKELL
jgi:SAM-dependent methyltransferase